MHKTIILPVILHMCVHVKSAQGLREENRLRASENIEI